MNKHKKILSFIRVLRNSFHEAAIVYTHGACYEFYRIMKELYPEAEAYCTSGKGHIVVKIDKYFYDIRGWYIDSEGKQDTEDLTKLSEAQHEFWDSCISTQLMKTILKKSN